jgi:predicted ribosome quality control (RQC) complex YloA/Tae2 family protein
MRRPRLEGVRVFTSRDGQSILVGKSGRDNDRLTFKLAGQEDFWLHAGGAAGAHVILRNDERRSKPSRVALEDAAAAAAWFSGLRAQGTVDVKWTRRKYVRRARGAPRGTVILKRFETIRVAARRPDSPEESR